MFTDMVGSTAAAQADEAVALELRDEQAELVRPLFAAHQGREIKSMGDGFLAEFESALKATQCAVEIQRRIYERNAEQGAPRIQIRIGIHLGDVEERGTDILGDAVNIAARIEPLAEPGGICLSSAVREQVWNKLPDTLQKLPPTSLKGVRGPMDIYKVVLPWAYRETPPASSTEPGIAVLPFSSISPDPKDEYFADGLTEELIAMLSQLRGLRVISRTSVMQFKSSTKTIAQIGAELGVGSILEGSVRKAGNRLRVTAQLIDAPSDRHLWSNTYDRELVDIFAVQTELAKRVAEVLKITLLASEEARLNARPSVRPDSYLAYLKGLTLLRTETPSTMEAAKGQFSLAISLDDRNAAAYAGLAEATFWGGLWFTDVSDTSWAEESRRSIARAMELDPNLPEVHLTLASFLWREHDNTGAEIEFKKALSLNPSFSRAHVSYAGWLEDFARTDEALLHYSLAEASDPFWSRPLVFEAQLLTWLGRFEEALPKIQRLAELGPPSDSGYNAALAIYYLARGDYDQFREAAHRFSEETQGLRLKPIVRAWSLAVSGKKEEARSLLRNDPTLSEYGQNAFFMAWAYAELGDLDECFRMLDLALLRHNLPFQVFRLDPRLEHVRRDPRFQVILKRLNLA
jgi:adenylate cyclase